MTFAQVTFLFAVISACAAGNDGVPESGCLLQNQFVNDKVQSRGEDALLQSLHQAKETSRSELSVLEGAWHASRQRRHEYRAHVDELRRTLAVLHTNTSHKSDQSLLQEYVADEWIPLDASKVSQSSTYGSAGSAGAANAVDGKADTKWTAGSCTHTNPEKNPWWAVDLGADTKIEEVQVLNRGDCCEDRLDNFEVLVDGEKCADGGKVGKGASKTIGCSASGKEVKIQVKGDKHVLTLCEVKIKEAEQCEEGSLGENQFATQNWITIPGLKGAKDVKDVFLTHAGTFSGAYVSNKKAPEVVRRKKGTQNEWFLATYDGTTPKYAKMIELRFMVDADGVKVYQLGTRYKEMSREAATAAFSSSTGMLTLWNQMTGQSNAHCDGCAGYGIKGLKVKYCEASADAVKAGDDMKELVGDFIDAQSGASDACHSQLLESRHQLNQLHQLVSDLAQEVNSTEAQIMVYDKMLEEKLKEMTDLVKWKNAELNKCEVARQKAIAMFAKLSSELAEMHSIANPSVAMDVKTGKLSEVSLAQEMSINKHLSFTVDYTGEKEIDGHHLSAAHHPISGHHVKAAASLLDKPSADANTVSELMSATRKASAAYKACVGPNDSHIALALLSEGKPKTNEECEAEKEVLEKTYVKAYVELSRMSAEYDQLANSTSCFDAVNGQYDSRHPILQEAADKVSSQINSKVTELQQLRPRLDGAKDSETKLREQVQKLTNQCKNVGDTVSDLDKVRAAIQSLSDCPGLARVKFSMPKWVGTWTTFEQDAEASDDAAQDAKMNEACSKLKAGSRAAEVGEIQEQTVEGIPTSNTAPNPLMGACPDCAGDADEAFSSGHARVCWAAGKDLTLGERSKNCGAGKKAILCVEDRADVRVIPGGGGQF